MNGMKWILSIIVMLMLVCGFILDAAAVQDLIVNGSFETGQKAPWYGGWYVTAGGIQGSYCAQHTAWTNPHWLRQDISATPGALINRAICRLAGSGYPYGGAMIGIEILYANRGSSLQSYFATFPWFPVNFQALIHPDSIVTGIRFWGGVGEEDYSFLDFVEVVTSLTFPALEVTATPTTPHVTIPAQGGFFDFNVLVENDETEPVTFDVWSLLLPPPDQGSPQMFPWVGPIFSAYDVTLPGGATMTRLRTQYIPPFAPSGNYIYAVRVGVYPSVYWDYGYFTFNKLNSQDVDFGGESLWLDNLTNSGEAFDLNATSISTELSEPAIRSQVSPNPFNPTTAISYKLQVASRVSLQVYDTAGRLVATLVDGWREAGEHQVTFDGTSLASGVYLYRLMIGGFTASGKMVLLK